VEVKWWNWSFPSQAFLWARSKNMGSPEPVVERKEMAVIKHYVL
jgi:hypothetical protein